MRFEVTLIAKAITTYIVKTKSYEANFVVTGCKQWLQSWHYDDFWFSVQPRFTNKIDPVKQGSVWQDCLIAP